MNLVQFTRYVPVNVIYFHFMLCDCMLCFTLKIPKNIPSTIFYVRKSFQIKDKPYAQRNVSFTGRHKWKSHTSNRTLWDIDGNSHFHGNTQNHNIYRNRSSYPSIFPTYSGLNRNTNVHAKKPLVCRILAASTQFKVNFEQVILNSAVVPVVCRSQVRFIHQDKCGTCPNPTTRGRLMKFHSELVSILITVHALISFDLKSFGSTDRDFKRHTLMFYFQ